MRSSTVPFIGELHTRDSAMFEQALSAQIAPLRFVASSEQFFGRFRWVQAKQMHVGRATNGQVRAHSISRSVADPRFVFCLQVSGRGTIEQQGRQAEIRQGEVSLYRADAPYELVFPEAGERVGIAVSADALGIAPARLDRLAGTVLDAASPLISSVAQSIIDYECTLHRVSGAHRTPLLDLIVSALRATVAGLSEEAPPNPRTRLYEHAVSYIEDSLDDPGLSPATVSKALFVSPRSLQQAFAESGRGVARLIRERLLERAVRELTDPTFTHLPISEIARRAGFSSASHFADLVRRRFGEPPSEIRGGIGNADRINTETDAPVAKTATDISLSSSTRID